MAKMQTLTLNREFQVWFYAPSHSQLLLRSPKRNDGEKRVDILFHGVQALDIKTTMAIVSIQEVDPTKLDSRSTIPSGFHREVKTFFLRGDDWNGYVVAYGVSKMEDDLELDDSSSFASV